MIFKCRNISSVFVPKKLIQKFYKFTVYFFCFIRVCGLVTNSKKCIPYKEHTNARSIKETMEKFCIIIGT